MSSIPDDIAEFGEFNPDVEVFDSSLPIDTPINLTANATKGTISFPPTIPNGLLTTGLYISTGGVGNAEIRVNLTSPSGATCQSTAQFTII
ncbi:MAG: hypothetical protein IH899_14280 [Planctomycetes bacterium]|nr:hypothetical protein [Planctomycetota bacterium]